MCGCERWEVVRGTEVDVLASMSGGREDLVGVQHGGVLGVVGYLGAVMQV